MVPNLQWKLRLYISNVAYSNIRYLTKSAYDCQYFYINKYKMGIDLMAELGLTLALSLIVL